MKAIPHDRLALNSQGGLFDPLQINIDPKKDTRLFFCQQCTNFPRHLTTAKLRQVSEPP